MIHSFPPVSGPGAKLLILGSMPGKASLRAAEYYAHPRNAFWRIVESVFGVNRQLPYSERCALLVEHHVAVWDVLKTCTRSSSLDSDIVESSIITNDFEQFFTEHAGIRAVYFNGVMAEKSYLRHVSPGLPGDMADMYMERLPSTSPANATIRFEDKLEKWQTIAC